MVSPCPCCPSCTSTSPLLPNRLNLPSEIVPATHKKANRPARPGAPSGAPGAYRPPRPEGGDRDGYRKKEGTGAEAGYRPRFAGVGRGAGAPPA